MKINRHQFLKISSILTTGVVLNAANGYAQLGSKHRIKAIAFDGFPIFDPRPIFQKAISLFPEKGHQFVDIWKNKQFTYQWLRALGGHYQDFLVITRDALLIAANTCGLTLSDQQIADMMQGYTEMGIWPDVQVALQTLQERGLRLIFLTNMTEEMVSGGLKNAGIQQYFEKIVSTDQIRTYKPAKSAYELGVKSLQLAKEEVLFVAFAPWDVAGAKWFGYPTFWVNRQGLPLEGLDAQPNGEGKNLHDLIDFINKYD